MFIQKLITFKLLTLAFLLAVSPLALAEEETPTLTATTSPSLPPDLASSTISFETRPASTTNRQELKSIRQVALNDIRQKRVLNLAANLSNRFDAASNRLLAIVTRLESRINRLENAGFGTASAGAELKVATDHIARAKTILGDIDAKVTEATTSNEPQNKWLQVREDYQLAATELRQAQIALRQVVLSLKSVSTVTRETDTTTTTSTTTE